VRLNRLIVDGLRLIFTQALKTVYGNVPGSEGLLHMTDDESETKFNNLVNTIDLNFEANLLTRVPSLKNMRKLKALYLESNKITRIAPGNVTRSLLNV